jgi:hypothetical protein
MCLVSTNRVEKNTKFLESLIFFLALPARFSVAEGRAPRQVGAAEWH